jgi:hypothetical protein
MKRTIVVLRAKNGKFVPPSRTTYEEDYSGIKRPIGDAGRATDMGYEEDYSGIKRHDSFYVTAGMAFGMKRTIVVLRESRSS